MEEKNLFYKWVRERDYKLLTIKVVLLLIVVCYAFWLQPYLYMGMLVKLNLNDIYDPVNGQNMMNAFIWVILIILLIVISVKTIRWFADIQNNKVFATIDNFRIFSKELENSSDQHKKHFETEHYIITKNFFNISVSRKYDTKLEDDAIFNDKEDSEDAEVSQPERRWYPIGGTSKAFMSQSKSKPRNKLE